MKFRFFFVVMILGLVVFASGCADNGAGNVGIEEDSGDNQMSGNVIVVMETNKGNIELELYPDKAPITVQNFVDYVNTGFYDGTVFHRVISNFMIQGGGFIEDGTQKKTLDSIKNEADNGLSNAKGTIAMARTSVVDSATSQFFINVADNTFLDHGVRDYGYAVFGKVISGYDIVESISTVSTTVKNGANDWPVDDIVINKAYVKN